MLKIPATGEPVESPAALELGVEYVVSITGIFRFDHGERGQLADACHEQDDDGGWKRHYFVTFYGHTWPPNIRDLPLHTYHYRILGEGKPLVLQIQDFDPEDNAGHLEATLRRMKLEDLLPDP